MDTTNQKVGIWLVAALWVVMSVCVVGSTEARDVQKRVLVLSTLHDGMPWQQHIRKGLEDENRRTGNRLQIFMESLDAQRFRGKSFHPAFAAFLEAKYADKSIDLIVTEGYHAAQFLHDRPNLLQTAERLIVERGFKLPNVNSLSIGLDFSNALLEVDRLVKPKTVYVVADANSEWEKARVGKVREALADINVGFKTEFLLSLPMDELLERVAFLPEDSAIFYALVFSDGNGNRMKPYQAARLIADRANVPMFSHWRVLLGSGTLGGYLLSGERVGKRVVDTILNVEGSNVSPFGIYYDYAAMDKWGVERDQLPLQAHIHNYEPSFGEMYKREILAFAIVMLLIAVLLASLVHSNTTRRQAVQELQRERALLADRVEQRTRDLTESEEKYRSIFEASRVGFALCRMDGSLVEANQAYLDIIGYTHSEAKSLTYWDLTPRSFEPQEMEQLNSMEQTGAYGPYEKHYIHKNGQKVPVMLNGAVTRGADGEDYIWSIVQDITEREHIERTKSELISTVSHELRTPLTSIKGSLELVLGGVAGQLEPKATELLGLAERNVHQLATLIDDILDLEKLQSDTMEFHMETFELSELVQKGVAVNEGYAQEYGVLFKLDEPLDQAYVSGDKIRLIQVLSNLLSNAAKFSPKGEEVVISITNTGTHGRVSVKDKGLGIPEAFQDHVFDRFSQEDGSDQRAQTGTGLGLSICKTIIDKHEGNIAFETLPDQGTTFYFDVPLAD
ncbi:PAS domain-containing sensor histidine kinase [Magnetovibrio sp. PR-2]|uniref:PAS domain-containing sensor histidine kinase n=1 Tax=Magnetovibrio sp. PR-2 TaxID=3120356 RepID=UPI002FCDEAF5